MKIKYTLPIMMFVLSANFRAVKAQPFTTYLKEDFENLSDTTPDKSGIVPLNWSSMAGNGDKNWRFRYGGYNIPPGTPKPSKSKSGRRNAMFQASYQGYSAWLITPKLEISVASKPTLKFYVAQDDWFGGVDYLNVWYKTCATCEWNLIDTLKSRKMDWVYKEYLIDDSWRSDDFYIGFEGVSNFGWGACLDSVVLEETASTPRTLTSVNVRQATTSNVPQGYNYAPIIRVDLKVAGNEGAVVLNSLTVNAASTVLATLISNGVSLFHTRDTIFDSGKQLGSSVSFDGSLNATFSGLNDSLSTGNNSIWVAYSLTSNATVGSVLDAMINAGQINIDGNFHPTVLADPAGNRKVVSTIFKESFDGALSWALNGEFQIDSPHVLTKVPMYGYSHPSKAYSGKYALGTDLTGLGTTLGFYENYLALDQYTATSPNFNAKYFKNIRLMYQRCLNLEASDYAFIYSSPDNGASWSADWYSSNIKTNSDDKWMPQELSVPGIERKQQARIRYALGPTNDAGQMSGWTVDNIYVIGDQVKYDLETSQILSPTSNCGLSTTETVTAQFTNQGLLSITENIPVKFTFKGVTYLDTLIISDSLKAGQSKNFSFKQKIDLSSPNNYTIMVETNWADDDNRNDTLSGIVRSTPVFIPNPEKRDNFENSLQQYWYAGGTGSSWGEEPAIPDGVGGIIGTTPKPLSPDKTNIKVWMTHRYFGLEASWLESPCYDLSALEYPLLSFDYFVNIQKTGTCGAILSYSTDGGQIWNYFPSSPGPASWNWYNMSISSFAGNMGFSNGSQSVWENARQFMPAALSGVSQVKFRVEFAADDDEYGDGFAIDNFRVMESPHDIGVSETSIDTACETAAPLPVTITVTNYGYRDMDPGDTVKVGIKIDNNAPILDTIILSSTILQGGGTALLSLNKTIPLNLPGTYTVKVYTQNETEPGFYGTDNDTLTRVVLIDPIPKPTMPDSVLSRLPHTVVLSSGVTPTNSYNFLWYDDKGCSGCATTATYTNASAWKGYTGWVQVTNKLSGCYAWDTTRVVLLFNDLKLDSIMQPLTHCDSVKVYPKFIAKLAGNDTLKASKDSIVFKYKFESGPWITETFHCTKNLVRNDTVHYTFKTGPLNFNLFKQYTFTGTVWFAGDTVPANDTLKRYPWIYQLPDVTMPYHDTTYYGLNFMTGIAPIVDVVDYTWRDLQTKKDSSGPANINYLAETYGYHRITITDNHGCKDADSALIRLIIYDVSPTITAPLTACAHETDETVSIRITNSGTDTIVKDDVVDVSYKIGTGAWRTAKDTLKTALKPGEFITHNFSTPEDLSAVTSYNITAVSTITGKDIKKSNDTLKAVIKTHGYPSVNLCQGYTCIPSGSTRILSYLGASFELNAGYNVKYTYTWNNNSHADSLIATAKGNYSVFVTDTSTGCSIEDHLFLNLIIQDIRLSAVSISDSVCEKDIGSVTIEGTNIGNTNISDTIWFGYKINNSDSARAYYKPAVPMSPGGKYSHTFTGLSSMVNPASPNQFDLYVNVKDDVRPSNNDTTIMVTILPNPDDFYLGSNFSAVGDTIYRSTREPIQLNPNTTDPLYTFLWSDGTTTQTKTAATEGWYKLTIFNQFNCVTIDSIYVVFGIGLINITDNIGKIDVYPNPVSNILNIQLANTAAENLQIDIISSDGRAVYGKRIYPSQPIFYDRINVEPLAKGVYIIRVYNDKKMTVGKFMIE